MPQALAFNRPVPISRTSSPRSLPVRRDAPARAEVRAGVDVLATGVQSLATAFEHELSVAPLETNALVTGLTFFLGDLAAQTVERMRRRGQEDGAVGARDSSMSELGAALRSVSGMRLVRAFAAGCLFLGPLTYFYYEWVAAHDSLDVPAKVLLDNTIFLFLDNSAYVLSLTLLGGGAHGLATAGAISAETILDTAGEMASSMVDELWSMQLTGWRILPAVAIFNYLFVPNGHRVLFMDGVDVIFAALLSLQHAHSVDTGVGEQQAEAIHHR